MKKIIVLLFILLLSCASSRYDKYEIVSPKITMSEAIEIAQKLLEKENEIDSILRDSVEVWEKPISIKYWNVMFKKVKWKEERPSCVLIVVNKLDGTAERVLLR